VTFVSLDTVKAHLRISDDAEDALLTAYIAAAEDYIRTFTDSDWTDADSVPAGVTSACLLLVGDLYENRLAQSPTALHTNQTVDFLLWPHRAFVEAV
jgi:uncharacterized phage protein (predicted DNA packaging)